MSVIIPPSDANPAPDDTQVQVPAFGGNTDGYIYNGGPTPGQDQYHRIDTTDTAGTWATAESGVAVQYDIGGQQGLVDNLPYGIGAVNPNVVDSHNMRGETLRIRRRAERSPGPVGASDYASQLQLSIAQQVASEAYAAASQASVSAAI